MTAANGSDTVAAAAVLRVLAAAHPFDALGLPVELAEPAVVKAAYRRTARTVHPDKNSDPR